MSLRRILAHLLLALTVLIGQQAMLAHAASHPIESPSSKGKQLPHGKACEQCMLSAQLGTGVASSGLPSLLRSVAAGAIAHLAQPLVTTETPAFFDSRAPPRIH
ncbi:MAG: hypothetical protein C5B46_08270 [Proteobacteria bacterium]|nr:MAG: hypothetical protein C5B46_08270 [Pseudomonadota bacterium]